MGPGTTRTNYLAFEAHQETGAAGGQQGTLVLFWPGPPGHGGDSSCSANVSWPVLDAVTVLGVGCVDVASIGCQGT